MKRSRRRYRVVYERDEAGSWVATIRGRPGGVHCVTQGRSIEQTRSRVREALAACLDDDAAAAQAEFREEFKLPGVVRSRIERLTSKRALLLKLQMEASREARAAARLLTSEEGMSVRDAAALLGVSFQRVQQLLEEPGTGRER
jgi:predicted RNase H-like HicB family nuclease